MMIFIMLRVLFFNRSKEFQEKVKIKTPKFFEQISADYERDDDDNGELKTITVKKRKNKNKKKKIYNYIMTNILIDFRKSKKEGKSMKSYY